MVCDLSFFFKLFGCLKIFFIEVQLIYNVLLIFAIQQSDSVIRMYVYIYKFFKYFFPLWFITGY